MTVPAILHRESFGYGGLEYNQFYLDIQRAFGIEFETGYGTVGVCATPGAGGAGYVLQQWGRGAGADQGYALHADNFGGRLAVRATSLGYAGAVASGIGLAFAWNSGGVVGGQRLCEFWDDDGTGDGTFSRAGLHVAIETLSDGRIVAKRGSKTEVSTGATIIGDPSTFVMPVGGELQAGAFTFIEVIPVIHPSAGSVKVYANGTQILNLTNVNTKFDGSSGKIGYAQICIPAHAVVTDWVVTDASSVLGDVRVTYHHANVAGTYTAGTAVGDATLLACVDEISADGDTTYIDFDDTGLPKAASFTCTALPSNVISVLEVSPLVILRKNDSGTSKGRTLLISGATEVDGGADIAAATGYIRSTLVAKMTAYATDPHTSAAWTIANCNAVEIGQRRTV